MRPFGTLVFAALLGLSTASAAQCAKGAHRPVEDLFRSDVVFPQEAGEVQLEMIPSVVRTAGGDVSGLGAAWEYGLTDVWQIEGAWEGPIRSQVRGDSAVTRFGGASVGTKRSFMCIGGSPYNVSIGLDVEGGDGASAKPALIVGRDFGDQTTQVFGGVVGQLPLTRAAPASGVTATLGAFLRLANTEKGTLHGSTELSIESDGARPDLVQLTPGLLWHSPDAWEFGLGYVLATTNGIGHQLLAHVVYEFGGDK